jgi:hypothetical protein
MVDGVNLYIFVMGNPCLYKDILGLQVKKADPYPVPNYLQESIEPDERVRVYSAYFTKPRHGHYGFNQYSIYDKEGFMVRDYTEFFDIPLTKRFKTNPPEEPKPPDLMLETHLPEKPGLPEKSKKKKAKVTQESSPQKEIQDQIDRITEELTEIDVRIKEIEDEMKVRKAAISEWEEKYQRKEEKWAGAYADAVNDFAKDKGIGGALFALTQALPIAITAIWAHAVESVLTLGFPTPTKPRPDPIDPEEKKLK